MRAQTSSALTLAIAMLCAAGCQNTRYSAVVSVEGGVKNVVTRNRYTLVDVKYGGYVPNADVMQGNLQPKRFTNDDLKRYQPDVFSDNGIRIMLRDEWLELSLAQNSLGWTTIPYLLTLTAIPQLISYGNRKKVVVNVLDNPDASLSFELYGRCNIAMSCLTPAALLCYTGDPSPPSGMEKHSVESSHESYVGLLGRFGHADYMVMHEGAASAYAIAAVLKKMEDVGLVDASRSGGGKSRSAHASSAGDIFEIIDFQKDPEIVYRYSFSLRRRGGGNISLRESHEARKALRTMIRDDYAASFPDVPIGSLVVDFPDFSLRNGVVRGRAAVLSLSVESLRYDSHAHTGTMRLRIGENQYEDVRLYARRNVESRVRDKNVALDAQTISPAAIFYIQGETMKGDILEIAFRTE